MFGRRIGVAAPDDAHHSVSGPEVLRAFSGGQDDPRVLEAGDVARGGGRRRIVALALEDIGAIQPGRAHGHLHVERAHVGLGDVSVLEHLGAACSGDAKGFHEDAYKAAALESDGQKP